MARAFVGLGSNLGDRLGFLRTAARRLGLAPGVRVTGWSAVYATAPWGPVADQPEFLNAALELRTTLRPRPLLRRLAGIEAALGRVRTVAQGPRTLDLDLLLYEGEVVDTAELTVPHPRLHLRAFVLVPLCDLAPDLRHPVLGATLTDLRAALDPTGVRQVAGPDALR
jgi:2-amino-4-hydroxy-6-hydroxymethyldihydropteridine diphosphokinase